jgi:hypothetical protein
MRQRLEGPFAWAGKDLAGKTDWIRTWRPAEIAEIEAAVTAARGRALPLRRITRAEFPLPQVGPELAAIGREIETGRGLLLLRGLPVERWDEAATRLAIWGIGTHLGTAVSQSRNGEFLGEVRDTGERLGTATSRGYRSNQHLRFHTDRCDVVALLCMRTAKSGGLSRVVSSVAIHNAMLERRPDLLEVLFRPYYHSRQGEEQPGEGQWFANPVFAVNADGLFTSQYSRSFVESAQRFPEVPRLSAEQLEAIDMLAALGDELALSMELRAGDLQLLNNHVTYHSRTGYEDWPEPERRRLLYRLWLSTPVSRALPAGYEVLWDKTAPGALRGGVPSASGERYAA